MATSNYYMMVKDSIYFRSSNLLSFTVYYVIKVSESTFLEPKNILKDFHDSNNDRRSLISLPSGGF